MAVAHPTCLWGECRRQRDVWDDVQLYALLSHVDLNEVLLHQSIADVNPSLLEYLSDGAIRVPLALWSCRGARPGK